MSARLAQRSPPSPTSWQTSSRKAGSASREGSRTRRLRIAQSGSSSTAFISKELSACAGLHTLSATYIPYRAALAADYARAKSESAIDQLDLDRRRSALQRKVEGFEKMRVRFMPGLSSDIETSDNTEQPIERVPLHLPSSLSKAVRSRVCVPGLLEAERDLRHGAMAEALEDLLRTLRTKSYLNRFKIKNITGVAARTRTHHLLQRLGWRVTAAANAYRRHRAARLKLAAAGEDDSWTATYRELRPEHVRAFNERARNKQELAERRRLVELARALKDHARAASQADGAGADNDDDSDSEVEEVEDHGGVNVSGATPGAGSMKQAWIWTCGVGLIDLNDPEWLDGESSVC
jgi:hypothetical protein